MHDSAELEPLPTWVTRWLRRSLAILLVGIVVSAYFIAGFVKDFQIFGPVVVTRTLEPLGPTPRDSACVKQVEKDHVWDCDDTSVFDKHHFGVRVWLRLAHIRYEILQLLLMVPAEFTAFVPVAWEGPGWRRRTTGADEPLL